MVENGLVDPATKGAVHTAPFLSRRPRPPAKRQATTRSCRVAVKCRIASSGGFAAPNKKRHRLTEIEFADAPSLHSRIHLGLKEPIGSTPVRFRAIERHIAVLQELVGLDAVGGSQ